VVVTARLHILINHGRGLGSPSGPSHERRSALRLRFRADAARHLVRPSDAFQSRSGQCAPFWRVASAIPRVRGANIQQLFGSGRCVKPSSESTRGRRWPSRRDDGPLPRSRLTPAGTSAQLQRPRRPARTVIYRHLGDAGRAILSARFGTVRILASGARTIVPSRGSGQCARTDHLKPLLAWAGIAGRPPPTGTHGGP
jgi:hypothetical protein